LASASTRTRMERGRSGPGSRRATTRLLWPAASGARTQRASGTRRTSFLPKATTSSSLTTRPPRAARSTRSSG
jgi:hypothetical protein